MKDEVEGPSNGEQGIFEQRDIAKLDIMASVRRMSVVSSLYLQKWSYEFDLKEDASKMPHLGPPFKPKR